MSRFKLFIENFLIYGLGGTISKIIPLVMLPIVTRLMPNTFYFGLNDLSNTVISFGSAFALMGMYDALFRMFFEKEEITYRKKLCSNALEFTTMTSFVVFAILVVFRKEIAQFVFGGVEYQNLLLMSAFSIMIGATNSIVMAPTRMQNKKITYLLANLFSSVISYTVAVLLLLKGMYIMALPLGYLISVLSLEIYFFVLNRQWFHFEKLNTNYIKPLLAIGLPLLPNFLIYWVFNACDRLMIAKMLGNEYTGIYAVGAKIAHMSQLIYTAFAGGWQYFAFSTMKDKDQVSLTSNIFEYLGMISLAAGMLMASLSYPIFCILFEKDYVLGYVVAPWLFLAPLMQMLYQVAANQFLVIKKTWPSMFLLSMGALFNIAANVFLIPQIGIEGASLATLGGYLISVVVCVIVLEWKMKLLKISGRFYIGMLFAVLYFCVWRFLIKDNIFLSVGVAVLIIGMQIYLYRDALKNLFELLKKKQ